MILLSLAMLTMAIGTKTNDMVKGNIIGSK